MNNLNEYQQRAHDTRQRKQAAGKYPTAAQKEAFAARIQKGVDALNQAQLHALASHPHLTQSQRDHYAKMAA